MWSSCQIVAALCGVLSGIHGADRDRQRIVAGSRDCSVAIGVRGVIAATVARRHHNSDSGLPRLLDFLAQRIRLM